MGRLTCCPGFRARFKPNKNILPKPAPKEKNEAWTTKILTIKFVNECIIENGTSHHTEKYWMMNKLEYESQLVVRRGQPFKLILMTNRKYNEENDALCFIFTVSDEEHPTIGHGTLVAVPLLKKIDKKSNDWCAVLEDYDDESMTVRITPSVNCVVAQWKMDIDCRLKDNGAISYSHDNGIYILFNPWNIHDQVYMESKQWRDECVLADTGLIWRGSYNRLRPTVWKYAQFEKDVLECSLLLVHKVGKVNGMARGDPVRVVRALSAAVNSPDDNGAVMGNWTDDFGSDTKPTKWIGSMHILQQYYKKRKPVKYGQCWVFAGVLSTICRALGIPSRPVTNYLSAHDTHSSLTVDYFVDENGKVMEELNSDSVWNFHVWNEAWMKRPDIGSEYDGWQAIDATPQELSDDMFRCGPASVVAVKNGEIQKPYDGTFLFAEVNADKVYWRYSGPTQPLKLLRNDVSNIGQLISTKAAGKWEREDITSSYKHDEKSKKERETMLKALKHSQHLFSRYYLNEEFNDIHFHLELRDDIKIGQPFNVEVVVKNRNKEKDYKVSVILRVDCVLYTGRVKSPVKKQSFDKTIPAGETEKIILPVSYEEYVKRLLDQCAFNIACLATVVDTKYEYFAQDDFRVRKPDIKIELTSEAKKGAVTRAKIILENPLPVALRAGKFMIQGPGLEKELEIKVGYTVEPGLKANAGFEFTPPKSGRNTIVVKFSSKELDDVDGFLNFMVEE